MAYSAFRRSYSVAIQVYGGPAVTSAIVSGFSVRCGDWGQPIRSCSASSDRFNLHRVYGAIKLQMLCVIHYFLSFVPLKSY